jgi:FkbM family methyltransferase
MIAHQIYKLGQYKSWARSVALWGDVPAALLLSFHLIPPIARVAAVGRSLKRLSRSVCIHPRALNGLKLIVDPNSYAEVLIYEEIFVLGVYNLSIVPFEPDFVVDCGGFVGHFALLAKARFPSARIACFEPHPDNFELMRSNLEGNGISAETYCAAVSSFEGNSFFSGGGFAGRMVGVQVGQSRRVKVIDLLGFLTHLSPRQLLLKIDIEGEERELLPLLIPQLPEICALFFEWHHEETAFEEIEDIFRQHGFSVRRLRSRPAPQGCVFLDAFALRA